MLYSTLKVIVDKVSGICARLGLDEKEVDNAYFTASERVTGNVQVMVGEIHMGTEYRLTFDLNGRLVSCERGYWGTSNESPSYCPVTPLTFASLLF